MLSNIDQKRFLAINVDGGNSKLHNTSIGGGGINALLSTFRCQERELAQTFGEWLSTTRVQRGLSVRALATKAGVSHATISRVEDSLVGSSREMVVRLADALEVDRSEAIRAWLQDETQEGGAIRYVTDPEAVVIVETYEGLNEVNRDFARTMMEKLREAQGRASIGGVKSSAATSEDTGDISGSDPKTE